MHIFDFKTNRLVADQTPLGIVSEIFQRWILVHYRIVDTVDRVRPRTEYDCAQLLIESIMLTLHMKIYKMAF